jgi:DNA-binding CsgD family transcriptional regulator
MPVHAEFLDPRGYIAGVGTVIQGTGDRLIHVAIEGFPSHMLAERAVSSLDTLRPHLARAISLTALRTESSQIIVDSLAAVGTAAAVIDGGGRLRSANALFLARMGNRMAEGRSGLRFVDPTLAAQLSFALKRHHDARYSGVQSVPIRDSDEELPFAIHLLPIIGAAKQLCESDGVILMISHAANACVPSADLLRLLFDLTPMEARVTRHLLCGGTLGDVATLQISEGTARTHLKAVFLKTGVSRQSELMRLLGSMGAAFEGGSNT